MWTLENFAAAVLLLGLIMYAVFAGADFGGGIWTAFASGPRAREQRESLFHAIGPVWETNHVWLIFVVVILFTAFPKGFAAIFTALLVPLVIALIGINLRGAAFAFRHFGMQTGRDVPLIARTFEIASMLTPLALGVAVTATATGAIPASGQAVGFPWLNPFTLVGGVTGIAICAYLTPVYMTVRTTGALQEDFRRFGMIAGLVLAMMTTVEIPLARMYAPLFAERLLSTWAAFFVALAVVAGTTTEVLLWKRSYLWAQICAAGAVTMTITGFWAAMFPDLLIGQLSLAQAVAPHATLAAVFTIFPFGIIILVPSLLLLYRVFGGQPNPELPIDK